MKLLIATITAASVLFSTIACAADWPSDGTGNAGMSTRLPNGTGGNDGVSLNAGMSARLPNGTGGNLGRSNAGMSARLPSGTGQNVDGRH